MPKCLLCTGKKWQIQLLSGQLSSVLPYLTTVWHIVSRETCVNLRACVRAYEYQSFPTCDVAGDPVARAGVRDFTTAVRPAGSSTNLHRATYKQNLFYLVSVRGNSHTYLLGRLNWNFPVACCLQVLKQSSIYLALAFDIRNTWYLFLAQTNSFNWQIRS